jgi:carbon storage regulator CsrA
MLPMRPCCGLDREITEGIGPMLVLNRSRHQSVIIETSDGDVIVMVTDIRGDKARLGFQAPGSVNIRRAELPRRDDVSDTQA